MQATYRTFEVVIGRPVYLGANVINIDQHTSQNKDTDAYVITDPLNIEFEVKKDNSKEPNKGYVTICNLSDETVSYLDANQRESIAIVFKAGFNGDNKLVFSGTVEFVQDMWSGVERKTKMILGDATLNLKYAKTSRSYRKGTPVDTVLNDLISDLKLPKGRVLPYGSGETLQHAMAFTGNASDNLAVLAKNTNSTFSVQDGAVYWTKEGSRFSQVIFEISEETGMHDSPTPQNPEPAKRRLAKAAAKKHKKTTKPHVKTSGEIKEDAGLVVTTELNGAILPESTIYLKSVKYTGFYKVLYVNHKGQYQGGDWITEVGLSEARGALVK